MDEPSFGGALEARERIAPYGVTETPLRHWPGLSRLVGCAVWVKHENHQPTGAFKVRGGVNLVSQLSSGELRKGVVAASTGNHGQSVAFAARLFGAEAHICVPRAANPVKVQAMRDLGADVIFFGNDFDEARAHAAGLAGLHGYRYIHSANEASLIEGVATCTVEMLEAEPDLEVLIVPVGGGSGAAGACIAGKAIKPEVQVIGVQAAAAPAAYRSWQARAVIEDEMGTAAEGLATRVGFELPQRILWRYLDDFVLVSEEDISQATIFMIQHTQNLVEGAGAAPLAAALSLREKLRGRKIGLVCTGGNITLDQLRTLLR